MDIVNYLPPASHWKDTISYFPKIDSTNNRAKALAQAGAPAGTVVVADCQSAGRGRMGRQFQSPAGVGLYLTVILRPDCKATELMHLTCAVAVAMCDAVEHAFGFRPAIKWTNDLVVENKKLGGILTELGFSPDGTLEYAIIGIGLNCRQRTRDFPAELRSMATSLSAAAEKEVDPARVCAAMLEALHRMDALLLTEKDSLLERYRSDCITLGQEISVLRGDSVTHGTALSVDDQGALVVAYPDGSRETVNSGEVSIRGMYGYI